MTSTTSEERLLEFLYACPVGLIECDAAGDIAMMNPHAMQHILPLAGARDASNLFSAFEQHAPELRSIIAAFKPPSGRICDGHRIFVDLGPGRRASMPKVLSCTMVKLGPDRFMATLADISQQVAQEHRLRQADTWFATLLDGINDYAALTVTPDGKIETGSESFTRQTGYDCASVTGRNLADVLGLDPSGGDLRIDEQLVIAAREGWHLQEGWQHRADGERYWCQRLVVARCEGMEAMPSGFSIVLRDVPRREAAVQDLRRLLTCDFLTGAWNRKHFSQVLEREHIHWCELRHPLALITLDLDHFKSVNDKHGHPVGDVLLCRVTEVCSALLPPRAVFARLGGEEFGALLPRHDQNQAVALAEDLRNAVADLVLETPAGPLKVTASFGCASLDEVEGSINELISLADQRMYAAKHDGRNRVYPVKTLAA